MKKTILLFFAIIILGSHGGIIRTAQGQAISSADKAQLTQELQVLQTKLATLQVQAAAQETAPASLPSITIRAEEIVSLQRALVSLDATLAELKNAIALPPETLSLDRRTVVHAILSDIKVNLANINGTLAQGAPARALASVSPNPNLVEKPLAQTEPGTNAAPGALAPETTKNFPSLGTAQASASVSLGRGWEIAIGVIILAIIVAALWRGRRRKSTPAIRQESKRPVTVTSTPETRPAPVIVTASPAPPTPMASVVGASANTDTKQKPA